MATKRPHSDIHPSRRDQVDQPNRKKQRPDGRSKKAHTGKSAKARARDVERLLAHAADNLPAHIRVAKERELQSIQYEMKEAQDARKKSKMIGRYHHIRFFERQKATRTLKKAKRALDALNDTASIEERKSLQQDVEEAEVDVNYAIYYPLDKPYHSMFPKTETPQEDDEAAGRAPTDKGDASIRELVRRCMREKTLDALRNGLLTGKDAEPDETNAPESKSKKRTAKHERKQAVDAPKREDEDSDGGFFE